MKQRILIALSFLLSIHFIYAQDAPWGISQMQFGPQLSWSDHDEHWTESGQQQYNKEKNTSFGLNGRIQFSMLDLLAYKGASAKKFRLVDVLAMESGLGYQSENTSVNNAAYNFEAKTKTLWWNIGVDVGIMALYRFLPELDLGVKYTYASYVNATFGNTMFVPESPSGRYNPSYRNSTNWAIVGRYQKFYAEVNFVRHAEKERPSIVNIIDIKYRYAERQAWAPYVGLQIGMGTTPFSSYQGSSLTDGNLSRNWIQLSIGKMTNF